MLKFILLQKLWPYKRVASTKPNNLNRLVSLFRVSVSCFFSLLSTTTMPAYRTKMRCAYADPAPKKNRAPKKQLTDEEKEDAKIKRDINKLLREQKQKWEATLKPWRGDETMRWPLNTFVSSQIIFVTDGSKLTGSTTRRLSTKVTVCKCEMQFSSWRC